MSKEEEVPQNLIDKAFGVVYDYRDQLIEDEKYEDVIALDKLIDYVKDLLSE